MLKQILTLGALSAIPFLTISAATDHRLGPDTLLLTSDPTATSSPYTFNDPAKAFEAINKSDNTNIALLVEPGVYWLDDPDDPAVRRNPHDSGAIPYAVEVNCDTLSVIGLSNNPEDIVFAVNRGQTQGALGNFTMFRFKGRSLWTENITFGNYCNVDLVYPRDPKLNRTKRREAIVQAQLGICENTDRLFARNCRFISRLNLCPFVGARRSLYKDCYFECTDDALSGSAVYLDCRFTFFSGKPFYSTASTGAVFLNCDIHTKVNGTQYLTKVPGMVTMIDTRWTAENPVTLRWTRDASSQRCYQSNVNLNGSPVTIDSDRPALSTNISNSPLLRAYKLTTANRTLYNTPNLLGGTDGWDPLGVLPELKELKSELTAQLTGLPVVLKLNTSAKNLSAQNDSLHLNPTLRLWGDYPADAEASSLTWSAPTTLRLVKSNGRTLAISANSFPREMDCEISAASPDGLTGAATVTVAPYLLQAPQFTSTPVISADKNTLRLDYKLSADGQDDSYIVWYRSTRPDRSDSIAVRHGRGRSAQIYPLSATDRNYHLSATVFPKNTDTFQGSPMQAAVSDDVIARMHRTAPKKEKALMTSFAEIPIRKGTPGHKGFWHFDTFKPADTAAHDWTPDENLSWYYGHGADAATGTGLVQATKGARFFYTPDRDGCRNMRVSLIAEPCKGPGQGFGSATGQYMDICLKFDPVTLSGYALRIERTPDYDKAVTFTLVKYENGHVTPISESVASNCYRTPCTIIVEMRGDKLTALARTEAPAVPANDPAIKPYVTLSAPVTPVAGTSVAVQHTGSVGASATLLRDLEVSWE